MPTINLFDTIDLKDNWGETRIGGAGVIINLTDEVDLMDNSPYGLTGGIDGVTKYIDDTIDLSEAMVYTLNTSVGGTVNLTDTVDLAESMNEILGIAGILIYISDAVQLAEDMIYSVVLNMRIDRNTNISFGETKSPNYKEYSHRFRWTNYNGIAVPDLNYKDLKEPIVRLIPAPSFLQFEYANSFLLFTRNSINRFILKADVETGQWRAETDNLIEEFKDLGLMEPKSLILAGDTLFGLSEKGVWMWNKNGMKLISDKIIDLPDAGVYEYIAFYSSIRNQYILHRQEGSGSYLQMTHGAAVSTTYPHQQSETVFITNDKFVTIQAEIIGAGGVRQDTYLVVGEVSGDTVTYGTPLQIAVNGYPIRSIIKMADDKVLISYGATGDVKTLAVGNISGTTITITGETTVTGGNQYGGWLVKFSDTRFAVFHNRTDYYTGTLAGNTITLDSEQSNWVGSNLFAFRGIYVSSGKGFIMYAIFAGVGLMRIISDNGDGTIDFGSTYSTTVAWKHFYQLDAVAASETSIFTAYSSGTADDLILQPLEIDGTSLVAGTKTTKAGWIDGGGGSEALGIANKGAGGFWLFYEDALNSNYLTAMWGSGSQTDMVLLEATKETIQTEGTNALEAIGTPLGRGLLLYCDEDDAYSSGLAMIWGIEYAAIDSFVYQIDRKKWYKFLGMDILDVPVILSGGSLDENYNLWLNSDRELQKYPGTAYTAVEAVIRTKEFYIEKGAFQRWMVDFEGSSVNVETRVRRMVGGSRVDKEDIKYNITPNKWRGISYDKQRGYEMSIKIIDANIIKGLSFDSKKWGED